MATAEPVSTSKAPLSCKLLRVLIVEDSAHDAELAERQLKKSGYAVSALRVETAAAFEEALATREWDVIIADYAIPRFGALAALQRLKQSDRDIPFIIVSGAITDEIAVASMRAGAHDYVLKNNLARLVPAIEREIEDSATRRNKRQAEETIRYLSAIVESSDDAIVGKTLDGVITSWNRAAERLYGYSAVEVLGRPISMLLPPDQAHELTPITERLRRGEHIEQFETLRRRKDGTLVDVAVKISPIRNDAGIIVGASTFAIDITERKRSEQALRESENRYRALFESIDEGFCVVEVLFDESGKPNDWRYLETNPAFSKHVTSPHEIVGKTAREALPNLESHWFELFGKVALTGNSIQYCEHSQSLNRWHEGSAFRVGKPEQHRVAILFQDVTDKKRAEAALIRSEKLASVGRMAATVAHEINNPLASAMNALFLASLDPAVPDAARKNLELVEAELERVAHITKQTLGFYRETGKPIRVNMHDVLDGVLQLYEPKLKNKSVTVERRFRGKATVHAIEGELRQIISNLVVNSIDAVADHARLCVRTSVATLQPGRRAMVRVTIADNGEGISLENLKRVFEPFFTTKQAVGTGLGLWVTRELVNKNEGRIRVRSVVRKGTVVSIWLPTERRHQQRDTSSEDVA